MSPNTTINGYVYLGIFQEKLKIFMNITNTHKFQHEGAHIHRTKLVSSRLHENAIEVVGLRPGNSPDLNPIEDCSNQVKNGVQKVGSSSAKENKSGFNLLLLNI